MTEQADIHKALSHPDRVRIMNHLAGSAEPVSVNGLADAIGISQVYTTRALIELRKVGLVKSYKAGSSVVLNRIADGVTWPITIRSERA